MYIIKMTDTEECPSKIYEDNERSLIEWTNLKEDGSWCENAFNDYCKGCYYCCCGKCGDGCICSSLEKLEELKKKDEEVSAMIKEMKEQKEQAGGEPSKKRIIKKKTEEECLDESEAEHAELCYKKAMGNYLRPYLSCKAVYKLYVTNNKEPIYQDLLDEIYIRSGYISKNPYIFRLLSVYQPDNGYKNGLRKVLI